MFNETYCKEIVDRIWTLAEILHGIDSNLFRKDEYGRIISRSSYDQSSKFGWLIYRSEFNGKITKQGRKVTPLHWENFTHKITDNQKC